MKMLIKFVNCSKKWKKKSSGIFVKPREYYDNIQAIICEYQIMWYIISFLLQALQTTTTLHFCVNHYLAKMFLTFFLSLDIHESQESREREAQLQLFSTTFTRFTNT